MSSATPPPVPEPPREQRTRTALDSTPNAEKYVLEADAMRRRQLRSALLHGSRRTWREHSRSWPAVVVGLIVVAVIIAALAVTQAFQKTEENQRKREREQQRQQAPSSAPVTPQPRPSPGTAGTPGAGPSGATPSGSGG